MWIDKAGRNDEVGSIDDAVRALAYFADFGNTVTSNGDIGAKARGASAIYDRAVFDQEVISHK